MTLDLVEGGIITFSLTSMAEGSKAASKRAQHNCAIRGWLSLGKRLQTQDFNTSTLLLASTTVKQGSTSGPLTSNTSRGF